MVIISPFGNLAYSSLSYFDEAQSGSQTPVHAVLTRPDETSPDFGEPLQFSDTPIDPAATDDGTYRPSLPALSSGKLDAPLSGGDSTDALIEEFREWAEMTPAERIRAQHLRDHGLTEQDLHEMDGDKRDLILADIKADIERNLGLQPVEHAVKDLMQILGVDPAAPLPILD